MTEFLIKKLPYNLSSHAASWFELAVAINAQLLGSTLNGKGIDFGVLESGYTAIDLDTFAMDNGETKKEGVGRTYAGVDGYCPFAVFWVALGFAWNSHCALVSNTVPQKLSITLSVCCL